MSCNIYQVVPPTCITNVESQFEFVLVMIEYRDIRNIVKRFGVFVHQRHKEWINLPRYLRKQLMNILNVPCKSWLKLDNSEYSSFQCYGIIITRHERQVTACCNIAIIYVRVRRIAYNGTSTTLVKCASLPINLPVCVLQSEINVYGRSSHIYFDLKRWYT